MNIFVLDKCPHKAARMNCDTHCSKIILEIAQMLSTNFNLQEIEAPYKSCHVNHPVTKWMRESKDNFHWSIQHAYALWVEKQIRTGKGHKSIDVITWAHENLHKLTFPKDELTTFALAMPEQYKTADPVQSYRNYYVGEKQHLFKWTNRDKPDWIL